MGNWSIAFTADMLDALRAVFSFPERAPCLEFHQMNAKLWRRPNDMLWSMNRRKVFVETLQFIFLATVIGLILYAVSQLPADALGFHASPTAPQVILPAQINVQGTGQQQTAPFQLAGGAYGISFKSSENCSFRIMLQAVNSSKSQLLIGSQKGSGELTNNLENVPNGTYSLWVVTEEGSVCSWTAKVHSR